MRAERQNRRSFAAEHAAAAAERDARAEIDRTSRQVKNRNDSADPATKAWRDAIARWHLTVGQIYTDAFWRAYADLKQDRVRDPISGEVLWSRPAAESLEIAIPFLEADPMCFRSGYVKEKLVRRLSRQQLTEDEKARLRSAVLTVLDRGSSWEFRAYCGLAADIADNGLIEAIEARLTTLDEGLRRRAGWMREAIHKLRRDT